MKEITNYFNCSNSLWRKMTRSNKKLYNYIMDLDGTVLCPKGIPADQMDVIKHNIAILTTDFINNSFEE